MRRSTAFWFIAAALSVSAVAGFFVYRHVAVAPQNGVVELMGSLPSDATAVAFVDAAALRRSPFFAGFLALAPAQDADADYAQFLRATGFNYERDLDRAAIAFFPSSAGTSFFAVVEGRFDAESIKRYALQSGSRAVRDDVEIYSTQANGSTRRTFFTFLSPNLLALTNGADLAAYLKSQKGRVAAELHERTLRLAGSPLFVILRQEALVPLARNPKTPSGLRVDQLPALVANLRWVTLAARPDGDRMRLVAEGECVSEDVARRVADSMSGLLTIAQVAMDDPKVRRGMDPLTRDALTETLKSADVSRIDRGETKTVRLIVELGPKLLDALRNSPPRV